MLLVDERLDRLTQSLAGAQGGAEGQRPEPCDVTILRSLPGVGRIVLATLLAEAFEALQRRDYQALRCLAGVAPVTKRSGKSRIVLMRQAAHVRLRNAVYHWARRRAARPAKPSERRGPSRPRPRSWPRAPSGCRSPHRRCLRHARGQDDLRPEPCQPKGPKPRETHLLKGGEPPIPEGQVRGSPQPQNRARPRR